MKKITAAFFSILIFSSLCFSQPGGGAGGPGGGSSGGPGGGSGPGGGRGAPSAGMAPGMGGRAPNSPASPGSNPPPSPPKGGTSSGSSSSPAVINYRGQRILPSDAQLEVLGSSFVKKNNALNFVIYFNQALAPEKFTRESVFFDGKNIEYDVIIKFNRRADSVTIVFPQSFNSEEDIEKVPVLLKNIQTFDGKLIEEITVK